MKPSSKTSPTIPISTSNDSLPPTAVSMVAEITKLPEIQSTLPVTSKKLMITAIYSFQNDKFVIAIIVRLIFSLQNKLN